MLIKHPIKLFSIVLLLIILATVKIAWAEDVLLGHSPSIFYCANSDQISSFIEAQQCRYNTEYARANFNLEKNTRWVKIEAPNQKDVNTFLIKIEPFLLDRVDVYFQSSNGWQQVTTGASETINPELTILGGFRIAVPASTVGTSTYYVAVHAPALSYMSIGVDPWISQTRIIKQNLNLGLGLQLGVLLAIFIFAMISYLVNKSSVMGRFTLLAFDLLLCMLLGSGLIMQMLIPSHPIFNAWLFHTALCVRVALWIWVTQALLAPYKTPAWYKLFCTVIYGLVTFEIIINPHLNISLLSAAIGVAILLVPLIQIYAIQLTEDIPNLFKRILVLGFSLSFLLFVLMIASIIYLAAPNSHYFVYITHLNDFTMPLVLLGVITYRNRLVQHELGDVKLALNEAKVRAEYERKLLSDRQTLIDMLAHELKNPLTSISLAIDNLLDYSEDADKSSQKRIANINRSIKDMDEIIERCNLMNSIENKSIALEKNHVFLSEFIHQIAFQQNMEERLDIDIQSDIFVLTDAKFLKVIFTNLMQNAHKYSVPNSTIKIVATRDVRFSSVTMTNQISATMMPDGDKIFERFYRHPLAHKHRGAGLGLYLTKEMCKLLGAYVSYQYEGGVVSFSIELPN